MRTGIILDKLVVVSDWVIPSSAAAGKAYAARVPPSATFILVGFGRLPFPRPLERHRGAAIGAVVADELHVGILMEVWVGVEFACDEILDLPRSRGIGEGETGDIGIYWLGIGVGRGLAMLCLAQDEVEGEDELVIAI